MEWLIDTYWFIAIAGTAMFVLRFVMLMGFGFGIDDMDGAGEMGELDAPADFEVSGDLEAPGDALEAPSDSAPVEAGEVDSPGYDALRLVTVDTILGFAMGFGWIGYTAYFEGWGAIGSLIAGTMAGGALGFTSAWIMRMGRRLETAGADYSPASMLYKEGEVYLGIPEEGAGRVSVAVDGLLREVDAVSEDGQPISSFTKVTIVDLRHDAVVVRPADGGS